MTRHRRSGQCGDYPNRARHVADCVQLTPGKLDSLEWLPSTCAYRLRADNQPLPDWHYLNTGSRESSRLPKACRPGAPGTWRS